MKTQAPLISIIILLLISSSCSSEKDFSGTYYWSTNPFYQFSNTFDERPEVSWPSGPIYHAQKVYILTINKLQITKKAEGYTGYLQFSNIRKKTSGTVLHGVLHDYSNTHSNEIPLNNIHITNDSLFFDITLGARSMKFYLTRNNGKSTLSMNEKPRIDLNSEFNFTVTGYYLAYTQYAVFDQPDDLVNLHDELINKQIEQIATSLDNPEDPARLFFSQFKSDNIQLY